MGKDTATTLNIILNLALLAFFFIHPPVSAVLAWFFILCAFAYYACLRVLTRLQAKDPAYPWPHVGGVTTQARPVFVLHPLTGALYFIHILAYYESRRLRVAYNAKIKASK